MNLKNNIPRFAVLLATHNGVDWIEDQVNSVLNQIGVSITIYVSDDSSEDGTYKYLLSLEKAHKNIILLPRKSHSSAARNFHYLLSSINFKNYDYISLCDQDDLWMENKLYRAYEVLTKHKAMGYSSDVTALFPDGSEMYIKKSYDQVKYDYYFESAGPGCTYVISSHLFPNYVDFISKNSEMINFISSHDWTIYAYVRSLGYRWVIDSNSYMYYKQHGKNTEGINYGYKGYMVRIKKVYSGRYRKQCFGMISLFYTGEEGLKKLLNTGGCSYFILLKRINELRRAPRDRLALFCFIVFGLFSMSK